VIRPLELHPDRLLPADPGTRSIARSIYAATSGLPIISPHGHTDPAWFAGNAPFEDATQLLLAPDHYLYRMLYSQGVPLADLGVPDRRGTAALNRRAAWRFAEHYHLFRGTPSSLWLDAVFHDVFDLRVQLGAGTARRISTASVSACSGRSSARAPCSTGSASRS
jgi:glucuronate isomerase